MTADNPLVVAAGRSLAAVAARGSLGMDTGLAPMVVVATAAAVVVLVALLEHTSNRDQHLLQSMLAAAAMKK